MPVPLAERSFDKGLAALADAQPLHAVDCFLDAMQIEQRHRVRRPDMRYLSYYGLSLARAQRASHAALEACTLAVRHTPESPVLQLNLGRVHLIAGRLTTALECFEKGLKLSPGNTALLRQIRRVDRRAPRLLSFLNRNHPVNRWLGKLREALHPARAREAMGSRAP